MAYRPGMTVYTGNTIEITGMGPNYTLKWKFTCNSKTYEDTIATGQSADTYKWRIPSSTFTPLFGLNVKGELHVYVYPNGSSTFGFGDYTYTLVLDPSIAPKIDYVRSSLAGKIYNNKAISLYTTISISFKVARVDGAMQTVEISDGRITYQMNVSQGSGYAEITQPFSTYTVPDDETNEYIDVNFSIDTIDARGRKASKTFTERVYKYVKPACKIRAVRNDDNTRISVYYEPVCQATVAEKANNITKIIGWIVTDDENNPQTLDLTNLASPQMLPGTVNSNESYMVRVAVIDSVKLSNTAEIISQGDSPIMDIGRDGKTVTFFGSSPSSADEYSVQIGKKLYGKVIFNENNIKFNYNQVEMFHLGYDIFTDDDGTHAVKKFVFGDRNDVKGQLSSAIGVNNNVIGECGIALGSSNAVSGVCSSAIGRKLKASGDYQTVVGEYNIEDTTSEYLFIVGNGTADNARENALGVTHTGHIDVQKNIYINTNGSGIFERDTDGTNRELIAMDGNNKLSIGYGQYSHGGRETVLQGGNKLTLRLKNPNATWRPYMTKGDSFNTTIQVGGYITNSGKDVTFQLPLNNPVIGSPTVTIASVDGLCVRQNNKYLYGSAASTFAKPSSYSCTLVNGGNHIKITAKMANTTNVENNSACGIYASIKVTFS